MTARGEPILAPAEDAALHDLTALLCAAGSVRIVHHLPGRVRFRLARLPERRIPPVAGTRGLVARLAAMPGIRAIRVNALALSCTVEYDAQRIPMAAWSDVVAGVHSTAAISLIACVPDEHRTLLRTVRAAASATAVSPS